MSVRWYQTWKMYPQLPMKQASVLPDEGFAPRLMPVGEYRDGAVLSMVVSCKPKPQPGVRWGHRVMVHCDCGKQVPFGRMNQHFPVCQPARS